MLITRSRRSTPIILSDTECDDSQYPGPKPTPTPSMRTRRSSRIAAASGASKVKATPTKRQRQRKPIVVLSDSETDTPMSTPPTPSPDPVVQPVSFPNLEDNLNRGASEAKAPTTMGVSVGRVTKPGIRRVSAPMKPMPAKKLNDASGIIPSALPAEPLPRRLIDQQSNHLALNYHPTGPLVARQQQYDQLSEILVPALSGEQPPVAVYVCGTPGTGKTFTVSKFTNTISQPPSPSSPSHLWVNCANLSNPRQLFSHIVKALSLDSRKNPRDAIRDYAASTGPALLIVLDEVDFLTSSDQMVLYAAFEWPKITDSRISVVGIANSIDLPVRLLPWLRQGGCLPEILPFTPYASTDLQHIVEQRLGNNTASSLPLDHFAISLAAKKVAAGSGDARLMLDVCQEAQAAMVQQNKKSGISIVSSIISRRGGLSAAVDTIKQLPVQQQLALCVAANAVMYSPSASTSSSKKVNRKATLGGLYDSFVRMCQRAHVSCLSFPEFADMCCNSLVHHGLVDVPVSGRGKVAKTLRGRPIRLRVPIEDVRAGVADKGFLPMLIGK